MACKTGDVTSQSDDRESPGKWLRRTRVRLGFQTLGEFAHALKIDQSQVSRYERDRSVVPDDKAERIAEVFGMDEIEVRRRLGLWVPPEDRRKPEPVALTPEEIIQRLKDDPDYRAEFFDALLDLRERGAIRGDDESD